MIRNRDSIKDTMQFKKKIKRPKSKSPLQRGKLLIKADILFRQVILSSRPHVCEWCGKSNRVLHVAHIMPKGMYPRLRYCQGNVLLLDYYCHLHRAHKSPLDMAAWLKEYKSEDYRNQLLIIDKAMPKLTNIQLGIYIECFKKLVT